MTANQIVLTIVPVVIFVLALAIFLKVRSAKKTVQPKVHGPHTPGTGNDPKEMIRSKAHTGFDGGC
ncbi:MULTISPECIES: hypothetical protein [unclassified Pseudovibrio]|uniref:hypothetical protein n=1 Tax=unclassified Pseudovibrio TaxID=2627060 RepID=UPI0007AEC8D2|nr:MULTISPECIES: hypothetical protein [unclassified Pseudovibrio]KZK93102.1 hypothetical protein PsW74_05257 [Pseudovibrio sp. W74]KZL06993.1 hypothetical protein PsAD14_04460 [Pseudovibrio sp. Ad14]